MKIRMGVDYTTVEGDQVRIVCIDAPGNYPVVGLINNGLYRWTIDGVEELEGKDKNIVLLERYKDYAMDERVLVRNLYDDQPEHLHFAGTDPELGYPMVWPDGKTSWSAEYPVTIHPKDFLGKEDVS